MPNKRLNRSLCTVATRYTKMMLSGWGVSCHAASDVFMNRSRIYSLQVFGGIMAVKLSAIRFSKYMKGTTLTISLTKISVVCCLTSV